MRRKRTPVWSLAIVLFAASSAAGQVQDTLGLPDTLYFGVVDAVPGARVIVPVSVVNDYPCASMTVPVAFPASLLTADSVSFSGGRAAQFALLTQAIDQTRGRLLIGAVNLLGSPIPPGRGAVAWIHFTVNAAAVPGTIGVVDTGYYSDPGKLLFLADVGGTLPAYLPAVSAGAVTVKAPNLAPTFLPVGAQTVREGQSLSFALFATDPDLGPVHMALIHGPAGALFDDLGGGQGQFNWVAPYTGPYSAGFGPFMLRFAADDGEDVTLLDVPLKLVNVNRAPVLTVPDTLWVSAYDSLNWSVQAIDPDLEPVVVSVAGLPAPAQVSSGNPLSVRWLPVQADTGSYAVTVFADDGNGGHSQDGTVLKVSPVDRVEFALDSVSGYSDQEVLLQIHMKNRETLSGFELLFNLDPTAVSIVGIDRAGTRTENWEMFAVEQIVLNHPGDVHIVARADINDGIPTPFLPAGEGPIVNVRLHLVSNEAFAGLGFPVRFVFRTSTANTALDAASVTISQTEISYTHGRVDILLYEGKLPGDINLNGLAFEVGDVVYFANFFSNPSLYPLSFEQRANSDVNGDGTPATIADLVYMINVLTGGGLARLAPWGESRAEWYVNAAGELEVTGGPYGGAYVEVEGSRNAFEPAAGPAVPGMTCDRGWSDGVWRVALYSMEGAAIDASRGAILRGIEGARVLRVELADLAGFAVATAERRTLPQQVTLGGNYPNPFNPATAIRFALPRSADVNIEIYNLLGAHVRTLNGAFAAGKQEMIWRGDDEDGRPVGTGVYLYRLRSGTDVQIGRMLLLK